GVAGRAAGSAVAARSLPTGGSLRWATSLVSAGFGSSLRNDGPLPSPRATAPRPWKDSSTPSYLSLEIASRTTGRETPNMRQSCCSLGSLSPGFKVPLSTSLRKRFAISSGRPKGRTSGAEAVPSKLNDFLSAILGYQLAT